MMTTKATEQRTSVTGDGKRSIRTTGPRRQSRGIPWRRERASGTRVLITVVAVLALTGVGCGGDSSNDAKSTTTSTEDAGSVNSAGTGEPVDVEVVTTDYAFEMPDEVPSGAVRVTIKNEGLEVHNAEIVRLDEGVSADDLVELAKEADFDPNEIPVTTRLGGPNTAIPFIGNPTATSVLEPADDYAVVCLLPTADGESHLALGMAEGFTVTPREDPAPTPEAGWEIEMREFAFEVPDGFDGQGTLAFVNAGALPHEAALMKLQEGFTKEQVDAYISPEPGEEPLEGIPPLEPITGPPGVGGITAVGPGLSSWNENIALSSGTYALYCLLPISGQPDGTTHATEGMTTTFTIP